MCSLNGDRAGIRTQDPQLRRLLLYPTELPDRPCMHLPYWLLRCKGSNFILNMQIVLKFKLLLGSSTLLFVVVLLETTLYQRAL